MFTSHLDSALHTENRLHRSAANNDRGFDLRAANKHGHRQLIDYSGLIDNYLVILFQIFYDSSLHVLQTSAKIKQSSNFSPKPQHLERPAILKTVLSAQIILKS